MGVREYDPKLSQFLSPDPLYLEDLEKCQSSPLQCSLYAYAGGNPISFVDPTGLDRKSQARQAQENAEYFADWARSMDPERVIVQGVLTAAAVGVEVGPTVLDAGISIVPFVGTAKAICDGAPTEQIALSIAGDALFLIGQIEGEAAKLGPAMIKIEAAAARFDGALGRLVFLDANAFRGIRTVRASGLIAAEDRLMVSTNVATELARHGISAADITKAGVEIASHSPTGAAVAATRIADTLRGLGGRGAASASADGLNMAEATGLNADIFITADKQILDTFRGTCLMPGTGGETLTTVGFTPR
jgi:hypothetical protein